MDSGHNLEVGLPLSVNWTENYADSLINMGMDVDYWTEVRNWCQTEPDMTIPDNYFTYVPYLKSTAADIDQVKVIFQRGEKTSTYPIWNLINGPITDAIYHCGQIVSFRRSSGNPIPPGVNVFLGEQSVK